MEFDIDDYKERTARLEWADLDLDQFGRRPLPDESLRCLRYMHDVEFHTVCYLRDLLLTPAHADPVVTAFLSFWVYEEYWHGEALAAVLRAHGEPAGDERVAAVRRRLGWADKLRPLAMVVGAGLTGSDFTAVHMTWGAINEWSTQAGYGLLARRSGHPVLSELVGRIMRQEGRHIDFYASQAERRLEASPRARRLARVALRRFWHPVGAGVMPPAETRFLTSHLFGDDQGRQVARRIDRRVDRLPGLGHLRLIEGAVEGSLGPERATFRNLRGRKNPSPAPAGFSFRSPNLEPRQERLPRRSGQTESKEALLLLQLCPPARGVQTASPAKGRRSPLGPTRRVSSAPAPIGHTSWPGDKGGFVPGPGTAPDTKDRRPRLPVKGPSVNGS